jgi:hypothetical protein
MPAEALGSHGMKRGRVCGPILSLLLAVAGYLHEGRLPGIVKRLAAE